MKLIKKIALGLMVIMLISSSGCSNNQPKNKAEDDTNWKLVWSDEFNENEIDKSSWTYDIGGEGWGNKELQYYTDKPDNAMVEDGNLVIQAKKENYENRNYTSARLKTQGLNEFKYGKIEAKMKLPAQQGLWPAFWLLGNNEKELGWPKCGEIDIMEQLNQENMVRGSIHYYKDDGNRDTAKLESKIKSQIDVTEYHNYSIEWDEEKVKWYVDDLEYFEKDIDDMDEFHKPFYIIFNLAVGGDWPGNPNADTVFPSKMYVDYVRVYEKE